MTMSSDDLSQIAKILEGFTQKVERENSPTAAFLVPAFLVEPRLPRVSEALGAKPQKVEAAVDGCLIDAYLIPKRSKGRLTLPLILGQDGVFSDEGMLVIENSTPEGRVGSRLIPFVQQVGYAVEVPKDEELKEEPDELTDTNRRAVAAYIPYLRRLSRLTGYKVCLHSYDGMFQEPFPAEPGVLHFVTGYPPAEVQIYWRLQAFDRLIDKSGQWVRSANVQGRGRSVRDKTGSLIHLLGTTFYFTFPVLSTYHGEESEVIFWRLLALAWNTWKKAQASNNKARSVRAARRGEFLHLMETGLEKAAAVWDTQVAKARKEIALLERQLADKQRNLLDLMNLQAGFATAEGFQAKTKTRLPRDFRLLQGHPDVAKLILCDDGLNIETKSLCVEYESRRYVVGSFVIRFSQRGQVSIWSLATRHPKGIPHPHLPRNGTPCFGSASVPITRTAAELRFWEAFELILRWLKQGYTPERADTKLEEWPQAEDAVSVNEQKGAAE